MSKKKIKFTNTRLFKILRVILIIAVIIIAIKIIYNLGDKTPEKITLVIGENKITLKYDLIEDDNGNIYISKSDIAEIYDENIYYNSEEGILVTTHDKRVAMLELGLNTMEVNSDAVAINGTLKEENGEIYLPLLDLTDVYDFEYTYNSETKVLLIDANSLAKSKAVVLKTSNVKEEAKTFSSTLEKIKKSDGQYVTVFGTEGEYTKVRTSLGNVGYIKTKNLSEAESLRDDMDDEGLTNVTILSDYNTVDSYETLSLEQTDSDEDYYNIVTPNLFNINESLEIENIIDLSSSKYESYKTWADESGINIAGTVTLSGSMNDVCSSYTSRTILINNLCNLFISNKLTMICIDFEDIDDQEGFYRFVIELTPRFKDIGYKVLVKYHDGMNKERLENIVDYVVE